MENMDNNDPVRQNVEPSMDAIQQRQLLDVEMENMENNDPVRQNVEPSMDAIQQRQLLDVEMENMDNNDPVRQNVEPSMDAIQQRQLLLLDESNNITPGNTIDTSGEIRRIQEAHITQSRYMVGVVLHRARYDPAFLFMPPADEELEEMIRKIAVLDMNAVSGGFEMSRTYDLDAFKGHLASLKGTLVKRLSNPNESRPLSVRFHKLEMLWDEVVENAKAAMETAFK